MLPDNQALNCSGICVIQAIAEPVHLDRQRCVGRARWLASGISIFKAGRPKLRLRQRLTVCTDCCGLPECLNIAPNMLCRSAGGRSLYPRPYQSIKATPDVVPGTVIDYRIGSDVRYYGAVRTP